MNFYFLPQPLVSSDTHRSPQGHVSTICYTQLTVGRPLQLAASLCSRRWEEQQRPLLSGTRQTPLVHLLLGLLIDSTQVVAIREEHLVLRSNACELGCLLLYISVAADGQCRKRHRILVPCDNGRLTLISTRFCTTHWIDVVLLFTIYHHHKLTQKQPWPWLSIVIASGCFTINYSRSWPVQEYSNWWHLTNNLHLADIIWQQMAVKYTSPSFWESITIAYCILIIS